MKGLYIYTCIYSRHTETIICIPEIKYIIIPDNVNPIYTDTSNYNICKKNNLIESKCINA